MTTHYLRPLFLGGPIALFVALLHFGLLQGAWFMGVMQCFEEPAFSAATHRCLAPYYALALPLLLPFHLWFHPGWPSVTFAMCVACGNSLIWGIVVARIILSSFNRRRERESEHQNAELSSAAVAPDEA